MSRLGMVRGLWYFVRVGVMDAFGYFVEEDEHSFTLCVHHSEATPAGYIPTIGYGWQVLPGRPAPRRVTFGKAVSMVVAIPPPLARPDDGHVCP